jgi:hypothetical protein
MGDKAEDITFVRWKFTLPESLAEETNQYANDHYAGNRSQFLRGAIKDHVRTLDGNDEFTVKQVHEMLKDLTKEVDDLEATVEEYANSQPTQSPPNPKEPTATEPSESLGDSTVQREVQQCLLNADSGVLTLSELNDCVDADPMNVQAALEELLDKEFIDAEISNQTTRYQIAEPTV